MDQWSACFFGKVPIHAEFVGSRRGVPELTQLDRWFQEGLLRTRLDLGRDWEEQFTAAPTSR